MGIQLDNRVVAVRKTALSLQSQCSAVLSQVPLELSARVGLEALLAAMQEALDEMVAIYDEAFPSQIPEPPEKYSFCQVCEYEGAKTFAHTRKESIAPPTTEIGISLAAGEVNSSKRKIGDANSSTRESFPISMVYLNHFMLMGCAPALVDMRIFPDAREITESMGMLSAIARFVSLKFSTSSVTCVCVGDGSRPRTAVLACYRTKWHRVVSVDPCLKASPKYDSVDRLELHRAKIEDVTIRIDPSHTDVVIFLPHAHVVPNVALGALNFDVDHHPRIIVVQLPCCDYEWHDRIGGADPDVAFVDYAIASSRRIVRVWQNVYKSAFDCNAFGSSKGKLVGKAAQFGIAHLSAFPLSCSVSASDRRVVGSRGSKPKRTKKRTYVVLKGYQTGIFATYEECNAQLLGFVGKEFRAFKTEKEAEAFWATAQARCTDYEDERVTKSPLRNEY